MKTEWKQIGWKNNRYFVSNTGKIANVCVNRCFYIGGCIAKHGYKVFDLHYNAKPTRMYVHRAVAMAFIPNPQKLPNINHKDGNKTNNNVENLEWCTQAMNIKHAWATGLVDNRGEKCYQSKLKEEDVLFIRKIKKEQPSTKLKELADKFDVGVVTISKIIYRNSWKHI